VKTDDKRTLSATGVGATLTVPVTRSVLKRAAFQSGLSEVATQAQVWVVPG